MPSMPEHQPPAAAQSGDGAPGTGRSGAAARAGALYRRWIAHPTPGQFRAGPEDPVPSGRFADLFFAHDGRLATKWLHYLPIYDRLLAPYVDGFPLPAGGRRPLRFLEIGVYQGGSLELWRKLFGPDAVIFGVDIDPRCASVGRADLQVRIGSQDDPAFLRSVVAEMGGVDVVLDDGSHVCAHQKSTFDTLFPLLSTGGLYVVEDTHTSYFASKGGGLRRPGSFIEASKSLVDGLHSWYFRAPLGRRARTARTEITSVQFFDSMVAIEKGTHLHPASTSVGHRSF